MKTGIVILAAGQGTRMKSSLPKVLHQLAGKPLLQHVLDVAEQLSPEKIIIVYGHGGEAVKRTIASKEEYVWVEQKEQLGTGHAVQQTIDHLNDVDRVLILYGDVPLINAGTLKTLNNSKELLSVLTVELDDPTGYGRMVRDAQGLIKAIVEHKDANSEQILINEVNTGIMSVDSKSLVDWLGRLKSNNSQKEYYLTDIVEFAVSDEQPVGAVITDDEAEVSGINDKIQLASLEREFQYRRAEQFMREGLKIIDPARFDIRGSLEFGADCEIDVNVIFEGRNKIGNNVKIGANTMISDCTIEDNVTVLPNCVFEQGHIGSGSKVGPFARIRPGTHLQQDAHVGNFVEIKNSFVDVGSKVNHLTYVGDSEIGKGVNIGAGTITCNYDGANKHKTIIKDNAFIGSNTALVAPVTVEENVTIGAGSVIAKDAPKDSLTLTRSKQMTIKDWKRPVKQKK